jgi:hypothetical protein
MNASSTATMELEDVKVMEKEKTMHARRHAPRELEDIKITRSRARRLRRTAAASAAIRATPTRAALKLTHARPDGELPRQVVAPPGTWCHGDGALAFPKYQSSPESARRDTLPQERITQ